MKVAFVFESQSPHLERLIFVIEKWKFDNQGVFLGDRDSGFHDFLSGLDPSTTLMVGPLNNSFLQHIVGRFRTICFSFATDIFLEEAHKSLAELFRKAQIRNFGVIVDTQKALKSLVLAGVPSNRAHIIPWTFGLKEDSLIFQEMSRNTEIDTLKVVFGRNLYPEEIYNPRSMLQIANSLAKSYRMINLTILAKEYPSRILSSSNLVPNILIRRHDPIHQDRFPGLLKKHDLFIQTNNVDGLSVSMMQSMASGVLVASSSTHGASEALSQGFGVLFDNSNPELAAMKILRVLKNARLLHDIRHRARARFDSNYSVDLSERKLHSVLLGENENCNR